MPINSQTHHMQIWALQPTTRRESSTKKGFIILTRRRYLLSRSVGFVQDQGHCRAEGAAMTGRARAVPRRLESKSRFPGRHHILSNLRILESRNERPSFRLRKPRHQHWQCPMSSAASLNASFEASGKNWDNREFISTIQFSILKMVEFLNRFGSSGGLWPCSLSLSLPLCQRRFRNPFLFIFLLN